MNINFKDLEERRRKLNYSDNYEGLLELEKEYHFAIHLAAFAFVCKGNILQKSGKHGDAIACYDVALKLDPKYESAYTCKNEDLLELGRESKEAFSANYKKAEMNYKRAIKHLNNCWAYTFKGSVLCLWGKHDDALKTLDNVIKSHPKFRGAYTCKGDVYEALGKTREAQKWYKTAKELAVC